MNGTRSLCYRTVIIREFLRGAPGGVPTVGPTAPDRGRPTTEASTDGRQRRSGGSPWAPTSGGDVVGPPRAAARTCTCASCSPRTPTGARPWWPGRATSSSTTPSTGSTPRPWPPCWPWPAGPVWPSGATPCSPGDQINTTEDRPVLHVALRMPRDAAPDRRRARRGGRRARRARRHGRGGRADPVGRLDRPHRPARSGPWSTSASAGPTSGRPWPTRRCATMPTRPSSAASSRTWTRSTSTPRPATSTRPPPCSWSAPRRSPPRRR